MHVPPINLSGAYSQALRGTGAGSAPCIVRNDAGEVNVLSNHWFLVGELVVCAGPLEKIDLCQQLLPLLHEDTDSVCLEHLPSIPVPVLQWVQWLLT